LRRFGLQIKQLSNMISPSEIVSTLAPDNGTYFRIPDLAEYAAKLHAHGRAEEFRDPGTGNLVSYILYYDNDPEVFISMVWTTPEQRGKGFATKLLKRVIEDSKKDFVLEVHSDNPAKKAYERLSFREVAREGTTVTMRRDSRLAIMQPYAFPYLGYFHLISLSDLFVFYDDVNYIKRGWINRNRILANGAASRFAIPVADSSQNRRINQIRTAYDSRWIDRFYKTLVGAYRRAPYFDASIDPIISVFRAHHDSISELAIASIVAIYDHIGASLRFSRSSIASPDSVGLQKADRLIAICKRLGYRHYVNASNGRALYDRESFMREGIDLSFVKSSAVQYPQFGGAFIPDLSIIDVMMFNSPAQIRELIMQRTVD
jgi:ribosomal protein S18 acetylase RimI-like enzyme